MLCFYLLCGHGMQFRAIVAVRYIRAVGFTTIFVSKHNKISLKKTGIKIVLVAKIEDVVSELFG